MSILIGLGLHPWYLTFHVRKLWMFVPICMCFNKLNVFVLYVFVYCMYWPLMNQDINWKVNSTLNLTGKKSLPNLYVEVDKKKPPAFLLRFSHQFINVNMVDTTIFKQYSFRWSNYIICVRTVAIFKQCLQFFIGQWRKYVSCHCCKAKLSCT